MSLNPWLESHRDEKGVEIPAPERVWSSSAVFFADSLLGSRKSSEIKMCTLITGSLIYVYVCTCKYDWRGHTYMYDWLTLYDEPVR